MNNWIKLVDEHKAHIDMLLEELKEKNEEIRHYRKAIASTIDELESIIHQNKSEEVLKHYAKNCKRFLVDALEADEG